MIETPLPKDDPLSFEDKKKYSDRLKIARKLTGQDDAVLIAKGKVQNIDVVVGAQDFRFIGGSFGAASGEAFIAGAQHAIENKIPYIVVLADPTTGGVCASFAMLGDILIAEKGATIGFAGRRVIEQTLREKLPNKFQTSEYLLKHGFVDSIIIRTQQKKMLSQLISIHQPFLPVLPLLNRNSDYLLDNEL